MARFQLFSSTTKPFVLFFSPFITYPVHRQSTFILSYPCLTWQCLLGNSHFSPFPLCSMGNRTSFLCGLHFLTSWAKWFYHNSWHLTWFSSSQFPLPPRFYFAGLLHNPKWCSLSLSLLGGDIPNCFPTPFRLYCAFPWVPWIGIFQKFHIDS